MFKDLKAMFEDIDAIFFDMDGTIIDSMWMWRDIDIQYLNAHKISFPQDLQVKIEGKNFYETAVYFKEVLGVKDSVENIMNTWNEMAMEKYQQAVPLKKGYATFLNACVKKGLKLGIATSNSKELATAALEAHGIYDKYDIIVTGSDGLAGKPSPDCYLACAKACHVNPARCLVFEDILKGIKAAHAAGMRACAIYDAYSEDTDEDKRKMADYYIHDYEELNYQ